MTPFEKLQEQLQVVGIYFQNLMDFPVGKLILAIMGVWWAGFHSPDFTYKLLAWTPLLWIIDFISGTGMAILQRKWTFRDMGAGIYRGLAWMLFLFLALGISEITQQPVVFLICLISVAVTEAASICDNILDAFPNSELAQLLRPLLRFLKRYYLKVVVEMEQLSPEEEKIKEN